MRYCTPFTRDFEAAFAQTLPLLLNMSWNTMQETSSNLSFFFSPVRPYLDIKPFKAMFELRWRKNFSPKIYYPPPWIVLPFLAIFLETFLLLYTSKCLDLSLYTEFLHECEEVWLSICKRNLLSRNFNSCKGPCEHYDPFIAFIYIYSASVLESAT